MSKFYRVHLYDLDGSQGFEWFTDHAKAKRRAAAFMAESTRSPEVSVDAYDVPKTKRGILALLQSVAVHNDNG